MARLLGQQIQAKSRDFLTDRLVDFVPRISPELEAPKWLSPYGDVLEHAVGGELRVVVAAPPQHGKTELSLRALVWWAKKFPGRRHAYVTYNQDRAEAVSKDFHALAEAAGLQPSGTLDDLRLSGGTRIRFTSVNGSFTGFAVDGVCIIDDPIKGPVESRSPTVRAGVVRFFDSVAWIRRHPGTSFVVMATRWHPEDLSGVLIGRGWQYINLKAIAEGPVNENGRVSTDPLLRKPGESLWHKKPPEFFESDRKNAYWWAALFQGEPRPQSGTVFSRAPSFYAKLPKAGYRGAFGLDLAYTAKTHADWSICFEGWWYGGDAECPLGLYLVDCIRKQVAAPEFALALTTKKAQRPGWKMRWYASGTEKGSADFLIRAKLPLNVLPPLGDKFVRATAAAAGWNDGKIFLPDPGCEIAVPGKDGAFVRTDWVPDVLDVVQNFTGVNDTRDDDVDALAALWDELNAPNVAPPRGKLDPIFSKMF